MLMKSRVANINSMQIVLLALCVLNLFCVLPANAQPSYLATQITGPATFIPIGMNDHNDVVGRYFINGVNRAAALFADGSFMVIDPGNVGFSMSVASEINNELVVAGKGTPSGLGDRPAYTSHAKKPWELIPQSQQGYATCINNLGVIAGSSGTQGFYFLPEVGLATLNMPNMIVSVNGINDHGIVIGNARNSQTPGNPNLPFKYDITTHEWSTLPIPSNCSSGTANSVSNEGQIVGSLNCTSGSNSVTLAYVWDGTDPPLSLGTLGGLNSEAFDALSGSASIIGRANIAGSAPAPWHASITRAFVRRRDTMYDLNSILSSTLPPGRVLVSAIDLNANGAILAEARQGLAGIYYILTPNN